MAAQSNAELAKLIYERFNQNDFEGALEYVADSWTGVAHHAGMQFAGKAGFLQFMQGFKSAFPDCVVSISHQIVAGDEIVNQITWVGTHTGPLPTPTGSIPASGRTVHSVACEIWRTQGGKLVSLANYQDAVGILAQIGALPMPETVGL